MTVRFPKGSDGAPVYDGLTKLQPGQPLERLPNLAIDRLDRDRQILKVDRGIYRVGIQSSFKVANPLNVAVMCLGGMGGSGNVARSAAEAMAKAGHHTFLLTGADAFWKDNELKDVSVTTLSIPSNPTAPDPKWVKRLTDEVVQFARANKIDLINVHYVAGLLEAAIEAKKILKAEGHPLSVVATFHGTDVTNWAQQAVHHQKMEQQLKQCDGISAVSHHLAEQVRQTFGIDPTVVSNSIDALKWNPEQWSDIRSRIAPNGELVLAHVSNLRAVKRPLDAIDTLAKIRQAGIDAKLMVIGDGPMLSEMHERAEASGIAEHVMMIGAQDPDKLPKWISAADINLVTSESESFCLAAMESMACGVPTVGTHCGGLDEIMKTIDPDLHRGSKLLANVGDSTKLAEICLALVKDPERYKRVQRSCVRLPYREYRHDVQDLGYLMLLDDARPRAAEG